VSRVIVFSCTLWLLVGVLGPLGTVQAAGDQSGWSDPIALSGHDPRAGGWFPAITVDIYGQVHVVWHGRPPDRNAATDPRNGVRISDAAGWLMYARLRDGMWSAPRDIGAIGDETDALRTALTADGTGRLHLLYRGLDLTSPKVGGAENEPIRYTAVDSLSATVATDWSAGVALSQRTPAYFPEIATDSRGSLHMLMTQADGKGPYAVYYRRSTDGGKSWSAPVAIESQFAVSRWRLQLKVGPSDDLNAVWEVVDSDNPSSREPVGFTYARSTDGGQHWDTTTFAPEKKDYVYPKTFDGTQWRVQPAVGVDGRGQIVLVWREYGTDLIFFQRSTDGRQWTAPVKVGGVTRGVARPFDRYDMATDSAGRLHLAMVAYPEGQLAMALLHSEWLGYGWGAPEIVAYGATAPFPEWPRLAIGEGNRLHLVWFGGSVVSIERVPIGIWYSTKLTTAPRISAQAIPSRVVGAAASPAPLASPMLVPSPAQVTAPAPPPSVGSTRPLVVSPDRLQPDDPWSIAVGLVGTCGLFALYLLGRQWWRTR
jgi:hypothetical protein